MKNRNDRREEMGAYGTMALVAATILMTVLKLFGLI